MYKEKKQEAGLQNNGGTGTSLKKKKRIASRLQNSAGRIQNILKRWRGQWKYFSPMIAVCDFWVTTVLRRSRGELKYKLNCYSYEKAKQIVYDRYKPIVDQWRSPKNKEFHRIEEACSIFVFWWQGLEKAPEIVRQCVNSVCKHAGKHQLIIIDRENWKDYVDIPQSIVDRLEQNKITKALFSDILRCCLLYRYGGIWIDATCFMTEGFSPEIYEYPFYTIKHGEIREHPVCKGYWCGFFLASGKNNPLFGFLQDIFFRYWEEEEALAAYLLIDIFLAIAYENMDYCKKMIDSVPFNNMRRDDLRKLLLENKGKGFGQLLEQVDERTYIHKLTYKMTIEDMAIKEFY